MQRLDAEESGRPSLAEPRRWFLKLLAPLRSQNPYSFYCQKLINLATKLNDKFAHSHFMGKRFDHYIL